MIDVASGGVHGDRGALALAAAGLATLLIAVAALSWRESPHLQLGLLALEHALWLPAVVLALAAGPRGPEGRFCLPRAPLFALAAVFLAAAIVVTGSLKRPANAGDESAYRFQARILATGRLAADAPPRTATDETAYRKEFAFHHHVIHDGKWFGKYPLGWPLLLSGGVLAGADWLVNPLLAVLLMALSYRIAVLVFGEAEGRLSVLLLIASPIFFDQGASYLSHVSCAVFVAASFLQLLAWRRTGGLRRLWLTFALLGCAFLVRPYSAVCLAPVFIVGAACGLQGRRAQPMAVLLAATAAGIACAVAYALQNLAFTGDALLSPYALYRGRAVPAEVTFDVLKIARALPVLTRRSLQATLFYAAAGALPGAVYALVRERQRKMEAALLAALFVLLVLGYTLQTETSDSPFGERYYFAGFWALLILAARGWIQLLHRLRPARLRLAAVASLVLAVQCVHTGRYAQLLAQRTAEGRLFTAAALSVTGRGVVFIERPIGRQRNYNEAAWPAAERFYMEDPGEARRAAVAAALGKDRWTVVRYGPGRRSVVAESGTSRRH